MSGTENILEFKQADLAGADSGHAGLRGLSLSLSPGRMALIRVEAGNEQLPIADAAEGLAAPLAGTVLWRGRPWAAMPPMEELAARAAIGRVHEKNSWISNLNVSENVTLSQRHHTLRPESEIMAEADRLAACFGLKEVPRQRPAFLGKRELKQAEWVRALIGQPLLLLLERPEAGVPEENLSRLAEAVGATLRRGAAAIWLTDRDSTWNNPAWSGQIRYGMQGGNLVLIGGKTP